MSDLTRSTGIVATVLAVAALVCGFLFSARATGRRRRPAWWLDLHNWLGGLALAFLGLHVLASWLDSTSGIGFVQILIPGTAGDRWGIALGVVAAYFYTVAVFTTWPRRTANRRLWRVLHLGTVIAIPLTLLHAFRSGSDAAQMTFRLGVIALFATAAYGLFLRIIGVLGAGDSSPKNKM
ncbi:MAG: hypothetical protein QOI61_113 [Actinomycetota bacterium]|jgi:predicted ferric reductase